MTINWATALALFTYKVFTASGLFPFKSFFVWSIIASLAASLLSYFAIDRRLQDKSYLAYFLDIIVSTVPLATLYTCYFKAYRLIISGKLGLSIYTNTSALKILWYSRIALICHAPNVINDFLNIAGMIRGETPNAMNDIVEMAKGETPDGWIQFLIYCDLKKLFYSVWGLLNLWVDWYVLRVHRSRADCLLSSRSRAMTDRSSFAWQEELDCDEVL